MVHPTTPNQEVALWQGQSDDGEAEPGMKAGIMRAEDALLPPLRPKKGAGVMVCRGAVENEQSDVGYPGGVSERRVWWQKDLSKY